MAKFFRIIFRLIFLLILVGAVFVHIKVPDYIKAIKNETADLNKHLSMLANQQEYETALKKSIYGDYSVIKHDMLPQIIDENTALARQYESLKKRKRLLAGHLSILTTKIIFDTALNRLKLVEKGKITASVAVDKKFVEQFLLSEISRKKLNVIAKQKNPSPIKPKWTFEDIITEIPAANSPERLMTGALGEYALYFSDFLIIHDDTKNEKHHETINHVCIQLKNSIMKKLYGSVYVGNDLYVE